MKAKCDGLRGVIVYKEMTMWICIRVIDREIEMLGTADTREEIFALMYNDMAKENGGEEELQKLIEDERAEICDDPCFGWSNSVYRYMGEKDWKCFGHNIGGAHS